MKTKFTLAGFIASLIVIGISTFFVGCSKDDMNDVVLYKGQVVYINTTIPFPDLTVKVTNGQDTHCQTQTDAGGLFSLKVRVNEIDGNYYLLAGDETCVPKKVGLGGYGQAEVDLGVIEVEGPALPTVVTTPLQSVKADEAILGGEVQTDGRLSVTARGICYGTEPYPAIEGLHTTEGSGLGAFTSTLKNLEFNTIYYARAYATNKMGTAYGNQVKFTTEEGVAIVVTDSVIRITAHSAKCKGHVESDGGFPVTKRGTCWSKRPDPTVDDDCTDDGSGKGEFTSTMNNLVENTTYYVRTYATNSTKTTYGEQIIITTLDGLAVVQTDSITAVTATGFTAYGTVVSDCDIPVTARGFCYSTSQYPTLEDNVITIGKGLGSFQGNIRNLQIGTTYYVRAYATNETGTTYSRQMEISTQNGLPVVVTHTATSTASTIYIQGEVTETWGYNVSERGFVYSQLISEPTIEDTKISTGKGKGQFSTVIRNLSPEAKYYLRAYAVNENGTSYGKVLQITTTDGKASVTIGNIEDIMSVMAQSLVTVTNLGGAAELQACGLCWSLTPNPTIEDSVYIANGKQVNIGYTCYMSKLTPNTTYYVRAYATTDITTNYSTQKTFTTKDGKASVTIGEVIDVTAKSATSNITVTDLGGASELKSCGLCWSIYPNPTIEDSLTMALGKQVNTVYTCYISKLLPSTTYYVRAYATTDITTNYSTQKTFTTKDGLPIVITAELGENITQSTIASGGQVVDDGGFVVTDRGVCWSTLPYPTISDNKTSDGSGTGYYSSLITGINLKSATYYVRAFATNEVGTTYGEQFIVEQNNPFHLPTFQYGGYTYCIYNDLGEMTWTAAKSACNSLVYVFDDWYLPSFEEMKAMMQSNLVNTSIRYWTSSGYCANCWSGTGGASAIYKDSKGNYYIDDKPINYTYHVRPVRKYIAQ
jgi:hypothetical protein